MPRTARHSESDLEAFHRVASKLPKEIYREWSGRGNETLNKQADRHDIPLRGSNLDLGKIILSFHEMLSQNWAKIGAEKRRGGEHSPGEKTIKEKRALLDYEFKQLEFRERAKQLVEVGEVRLFLEQMATQLAALGESLEARYGQDAGDEVRQMLTTLERELREQEFYDGNADANPYSDPAESGDTGDDAD